MPRCLIPNCPNNGQNNITVRLRREDTSAIWAPNSEGYLCDTHADQGYTIEVTLTPNANRTITTNVSAGGAVATRTTNIIHHP